MRSELDCLLGTEPVSMGMIELVVLDLISSAHYWRLQISYLSEKILGFGLCWLVRKHIIEVKEVGILALWYLLHHLLRRLFLFA